MAVAVAAVALLYAPFAAAAGLPRLWDSLVAEAARDGSWWRLPFPLDYDGPLRGWPPRALAEDGKDALGYYLPLIGVAGLALTGLALARPGGGSRPRSPGCSCSRSARSRTCSRAPTSCTSSRC